MSNYRSGRRGLCPWLSWLGTGVCLIGATLVMASSAKGAQTGPKSAAAHWETVFRETFEDGIGAGWTTIDASDDDGGEYTWGTSSFISTSAGHSVWGVGGGHDGGDLVAGEEPYPDNVDSWLIYGPIHLGDALDARLRFDWWLETEAVGEAHVQRSGEARQALEQSVTTPDGGDWFGWCVLTEEADLEGARCTYVSGSTGGWMKGEEPLADYVPNETVTADGIWLAFRFVTDDDGAGARGAFVDSVTVEVASEHHVFLPLLRRDAAPSPGPSPESLLENGSFEDGWYDVKIGQVPNSWEWHWVDGETLPGSDDPALAPESRVLPQDQIPEQERAVFFLDGWYCVKVFKGRAPIYAALSQHVSGLEVGRQYRFTAPVYIDVYKWDKEKEEKVAPGDAYAAQVRLGVGPTDATWRDEEAISYSGWWHGENTDDFFFSYHDFSLDFTATETDMTVYVELFAKWGLDNNGFFMDDMTLVELP